MSRTALQVLFVVGITGLLSAELGAADRLPGLYVLRTESSALVGCLDLCGCPLEEVPDLSGSFYLDLQEAGATFTVYAVENVAWVLGTDPPLAVRGSGKFDSRIERDQWVETFELTLSVGDEAPVFFRSEPRIRAEPVHQILSDVRPAELVCFGQVFRLDATWSRETAFVRGDSNADNALDIADAIFTLSYLFAEGPPPACLDAADANDDEAVDLADGVYILQNLFANGPAIPPPSPDCGLDPTVDALGCVEYTNCE